MACSGVGFVYCGETTDDGRDRQRPRGEISDVEGDGFRSGWQELDAVRFAPPREVVPIRTVGADRRGRAGPRDEGIGASNQLLKPARRGV